MMDRQDIDKAILSLSTPGVRYGPIKEVHEMIRKVTNAKDDQASCTVLPGKSALRLLMRHALTFKALG